MFKHHVFMSLEIRHYIQIILSYSQVRLVRPIRHSIPFHSILYNAIINTPPSHLCVLLIHLPRPRSFLPASRHRLASLESTTRLGCDTRDSRLGNAVCLVSLNRVARFPPWGHAMPLVLYNHDKMLVVLSTLAISIASKTRHDGQTSPLRSKKRGVGAG